MQGIINIFKPQDYTSFDCVAILRRALGEKKVGHTGTLDPMATGVLPCCVGRATRIIEYLEDDTKEYKGRLKLGSTSSTCDIWGDDVKTDEALLTSFLEQGEEKCRQHIEKAFRGFIGDIEQIPPKYSAIKVDGKKLYEYARKGQEVEIKPRKVHIESIEIEDIDLKEGVVDFTMVCSKGTYVRSLCRDVGEVLGCGGLMEALTRTRNGAMTLEAALNIEDVKTMKPEELEKHMVPMEDVLSFMGSLEITRDAAFDLIDGKHLDSKDLEVRYDRKSEDKGDRSSYEGAISLERAIEEGKIRSERMDHKRVNYRVFSEEEFIGIAYYSPRHKKIVADKILNPDFKDRK